MFRKSLLFIVIIFFAACGARADMSTPESLFLWELVKTSEISSDLYDVMYAVYAYFDTSKIMQVRPESGRYIIINKNYHNDESSYGTAYLLAYDEDFKLFRETKIKGGKGPGEFTMSKAVDMVPWGDLIGLHDVFLNRITWFTEDLEFEDTENIDNIQRPEGFYHCGAESYGFIIKNNEKNTYTFTESDKSFTNIKEYASNKKFREKDFAGKCFETDDLVLMRSNMIFLMFDKDTKKFSNFELKVKDDHYHFINYFDGRYLHMTPWDEEKMSYVYDIKTGKIYEFKDRRMFIWLDDSHILEFLKKNDKCFVKTYRKN